MDEHAELKTEITQLSERVIAYEAAVGDVVALLGHEGNDPDDLRDAVGQIERLLAGKDRDVELTGLAEQLRQLLHPDSTFYVLPRGRHTMVKTAEFFRAQGGLKEPWGSFWRSVIATSIGQARRLGAVMEPFDDSWTKATPAELAEMELEEP
jgi:hypothetical protein